MPSVTQIFYEPVCGKKRRREDSADDNHHETSKCPNTIPSRTTPLADSIQVFSNQLRENSVLEKRQILMPKALRIHSIHESSKRQRIERVNSAPAPYLSPLEYEPSSYFQYHPQSTNTHPNNTPMGWSTLCEQSASAGLVKPKPKVDLSACHICHRKPTAKHELDAFADCEGCGKRTCWICIRHCEGWGVGAVTSPANHNTRENSQFECGFGRDGGSDGDGVNTTGNEDLRRNWNSMREMAEGHRGMVCSRCSIERGSDGEVWCLGCLKIEDGLEYL